MQQGRGRTSVASSGGRAYRIARARRRDALPFACGARNQASASAEPPKGLPAVLGPSVEGGVAPATGPRGAPTNTGVSGPPAGAAPPAAAAPKRFTFAGRCSGLPNPARARGVIGDPNGFGAAGGGFAVGEGQKPPKPHASGPAVAAGLEAPCWLSSWLPLPYTLGAAGRALAAAALKAASAAAGLPNVKGLLNVNGTAGSGAAAVAAGMSVCEVPLVAPALLAASRGRAASGENGLIGTAGGAAGAMLCAGALVLAPLPAENTGRTLAETPGCVLSVRFAFCCGAFGFVGPSAGREALNIWGKGAVGPEGAAAQNVKADLGCDAGCPELLPAIQPFTDAPVPPFGGSEARASRITFAALEVLDLWHSRSGYWHVVHPSSAKSRLQHTTQRSSLTRMAYLPRLEQQLIESAEQHSELIKSALRKIMIALGQQQRIWAALYSTHGQIQQIITSQQHLSNYNYTCTGAATSHACDQKHTWCH